MKTKIRIFIALVAISAAVAAGFMPSPGYQPGDKARDFKLKNVDGKMVSLAGYKDAKGFIVVFTCNHCPFSVKYEDRIIGLHKMFESKGYPVIAINPNDKNIVPEDSYEEMVVRAKEKGFTFAYLYDESQDIAKAYGAARTPHVFILTKKGKDNVVQYIGAIDNSTDDADAATEKYVEKAMEEILAGNTVSTPTTKAIGCTIKWRKA